MSQKAKVISATALMILFILFLILIKTVDVAPIGPNGSEVGFSTLNGAVHDAIGIHMGWYKLTQVFGILAILTVAAFAVLGVLQLIVRKSLFKVDALILTAGVLYAMMFVLYVLFEKAAVNFRPIIMPGETELEASFPSSHTMLICTVMGSAIILLKKYVKNPALLLGLRALCIIVITLTVIGRFVSGVHWMTDIIGGVLLSLALLAWFHAGLKWIRKLTRRFARK